MRLAFIGGFGHHYLRLLPKEPAVEIERPIAFAPDGPEDSGAGRIAETAGELKLFDDPIRLLDEYRPDVLSIGAINAHNGDIIAAALERGITRIVSDKPIAATWEQLERIRKLAETGSPKILTEFEFRSRPEFRAARNAIRAGKIGQVVLATAQKSYRFGRRPAWYAERSQFGGLMLWIASHAIDGIRFTTGLRFRSVMGRQGNISRPEWGTLEDHCTAIFEMENGATGIVHADYARPDKTAVHGDDRLRVAGSQGVLEIRNRQCLLLGADGIETDITKTAQPRPVHLEMISALSDDSDELYGTETTLELAAVLLHARDAADKQERVEMPASR